MADHLYQSRAVAWLLTVSLVSLMSDSSACFAEPPITALAFSNDFQQVTAGSQHGLVRIAWPSRAFVAKKDVELDSIHDISFSPDGKNLLVAGGSPGSSGVVQLRGWPDLELRQVWSEHQDVVYQVAWRDDGQEWISVSWDGYANVTRLNATESHVTMTSHSGPVLAATYLDAETIATAGADRTIAVWNAATGVPSRILRQHTGTVHALAVQPVSSAGQERFLASASEDRTVRFWQPNLGRMVRFQRFSSVPRSIAWSKDGAWLVVGCDDGQVVRLDAVSLKITNVSDFKERVLNVLVGANDDWLCLSAGSETLAIELPE